LRLSEGGLINRLIYQPHKLVLIRLNSLKHLRVLLTELFQQRLQQLRPLLQNRESSRQRNALPPT